MKYFYEIDFQKENRMVRGECTDDPSNVNAFDFQPISFSNEDLDLDSNAHEGFLTSQLDTLVVLFTGQDPAEELMEAQAACPHEDSAECPCPPASIKVPMVLAYHMQTLWQNLSPECQGYGSLTDEERMKILNRWFEQGIALKR